MIELKKTVRFNPHPYADIWTITARKWKKDGKIQERIRVTREEERNFHKFFFDTQEPLSWDDEDKLTRELIDLLHYQVKEYLYIHDHDDQFVTDYMDKFPLPIDE